ncbi:MAG: ABC transporter ATP-binding protein [Spirochaetia bacterium]|jgi:branched-chain amino acid transport system ATP-binding protein|nr:ABC transporter ATP-binding protein [Spirochaetia bacterium]
MSDLLTIEGIGVSYGNIKALSSVSMHVAKGDIVSLIGANGAGKSTLLKAIVGLEPLGDGTITYDGQVICSQHRKTSLPTELIAGKGISLVPEGRRVFTEMTVEENLDMGAFLIRDDKQIREKKEEMFDFFPILGERRKQKTQSLSGGEQQMMAIARAMMSSPRLLLLDEPGLGLAPLIIQDIFEKIRYINETEKVTIFLVEQNAKIALKASTSGYVMENGRIVLEGPSQELLDNKTVQQAYLGG